MAVDRGTQIDIRVLGGFDVRTNERVLIDDAWPRRKAAALIKLLALQPARVIPREQVLDALWPDLSPTAAANNLHKSTFHLRSALSEGAPAIITVADGTVSLNATARVDLDLFRTAAAAASESRTNIEQYEQALHLCPGELLPADRYEPWTEPIREQVNATRTALLLEVIALLELQRDWPGALRWIAELRIAGATEEYHRAAMRVYALSGERERALQEYERCREALQRDLGVPPSAKTEELLHDITAGRLGPSRSGPTGVAAGALVGRESEMSELRAALREAVAGTGGLALIEGEPGIGKTRLAEELAGFAHIQGVQVLWGRCDGAQTAPAFWPWLQALAPLTAKGDGAEPSGISQLVPPAASARGSTDVRSDDARRDDARGRVFQAVSDLLRAASRRRPLLLVLDDLHDADAASLQLVRHVARENRGLPLLIALTYRDVETSSGHPLGEVLPDLLRERLKARVTLDGLSELEVGHFIEIVTGAAPPTRSVTAIHDETHGNPFFVNEYARLLGSDGVDRMARERPGAPPLVPRTVNETVRQRLSALSPTCGTALSRASVIGRQFPETILRRIGGIPAAALSEALEEAREARLLRLTEEGAWTFVHALIQRVAYQSLPASERARLHRSAAHATEAESGRERAAAALAYHYVEAARIDGDMALAIEASVEAGDAALRDFAWEDAIRHWMNATRFMEQSGSDPEQLAVLLERIETLVFSTGGDFEDGVACLQRALAIRQRLGQPERVAQVHSRLGRALSTHLGDPRYGRFMDLARALQHYRAAEPVFAEGPDRPSKAYFFTAMATTAFNAVRISEGLDAARRARAVADRVGAASILSSALFMHGVLLKASGNLSEARALLEESYAIADAENFPSLAYYAITSVADWTEGYVAGRGDLLAQELGKPRFADESSFRTGLRDDLGAALCISGRLDEARALLPLAGPGSLQPMIAVYDGDWESIRRVWRQERDLLERTGNRSAFANRCHLLADLCRVIGDLSEAEQLRRLELSIALDGGNRLLELRARSDMTLLLIETGRVQEAGAHIASACEIIARGGDWGRKGVRAEMAQAAFVSARDGVPDEAGFGRAAANFERLELPWDQAETHLLWARAARTSSDPDGAATHLREATAIYDRIRAASRWLERARQFAD